MKRLILTTVLVSTILLAGAKTSSAALVEAKVNSTNIGIEFEGDAAAEGPLKNRLAMIWKPSAFDFNKQLNKAEGKLVVYDAIETPDNNYIVINDNREYAINADAGKDAQLPGNVDDKKGGPWVLKAKMDKLTSGKNELVASLGMDISEAKVYKVGDKLTLDGKELVPAPAKEGTTTDKAQSVSGVTKLNLEAGGSEETVLTKATASTTETGVSTQVSNVKLQTLATAANAQGKAFSSKVIWTLYIGV